MRRPSVLALTALALLGSATAVSAEGSVTDVVGTVSATGVVTITGVGVGALTGPAQTTGSTTIGSASSALPGAVLQVTDATGTANGWDVTATYDDLTSGQLSALVAGLPSGVTQVLNIGGHNVSVSASTTSAQALANSTLGVASPALRTGTLSSPVNLVSADNDGRGVTAFSTSYTLSLPAKSAAAATLYTGKITYTVAPQAS